MARKLPARRDAALPDLTKALSVIQAHISNGKYDEIPDGFLTVEQISEQWRKSPRQTRTLLLHASKHGLAECRVFRIKGRAVGHFRLTVAGI